MPSPPANLKRIRQLREERIVSVQELESAEWREAAAAKEMAAAESALRQAEAELADFRPGTAGAPELAKARSKSRRR